MADGPQRVPGVLVIYGGEYTGEQIEVAGDRLSIGRSTECDIILRNKDVSSRHAQLVIRDKVCWLQDLGSSNGTLLKKRKIIQHPLASGDEFYIVNYRFVYAENAEAFAEKAEATMEEIRQKLHAQLIGELNLKRLTLAQMADQSLRRRAGDVLDKLIEEREKDIPAQYDRAELKKAVLDAALGLGPLEDLLADAEVTEIMVNGPQKIYVERNGKLQKTTKSFLGKNEILTSIERIVGPIGRRIDESSPTVDARLQDGSRVHAIIPPLALDSPTITIRKFPKKRIVADDLVHYGSMSQPMAEFLRICVLAVRNMVISGGTGSGKTTLLNVMGAFIPDGERIITIEDSAELRLPQEHVIRLETRPSNIEGTGEVTIRDLVRNALRMRPNRVVVGECRGGEALDMLQAMNTGHDGSLTTVHANSPADAVRRLENLVLYAGTDLPLRAIRDLIFSAVHLFVQISRFSDGSRKLISIAEVASMHDGEIKLQEIFKYRRTGIGDDGRIQGQFSATGIIPTFVEELRQAGLAVDMAMFVPTSVE
ncbi:MAG: ATPase, T2SS/T4P/T4SS family [Verrucomicrobiae bacterium]|nr:ATPase, T2SS/T4P/T4SS family [Verrucomicrobiae bacterium]